MRTIVITGGTGGLGTAVVERLERDYRCVVLGHRDVDLIDEASVKRAFDAIGELYGLVHLVGGFAPGRIGDTSLDTWTSMLSVNATTAFLATREALVRMTRPGRIVAVSSIATLTPAAGSAAYFVAKSALNALIQIVAAETRDTGITANAVLPDAMATPAMLKEMDPGKLVPLPHVTETIAWLLSEGAAGTTGALLPIRK